MFVAEVSGPIFSISCGFVFLNSVVRDLFALGPTIVFRQKICKAAIARQCLKELKVLYMFRELGVLIGNSLTASRPFHGFPARASND